MEIGTLCHFWHTGANQIKVGKIVELPNPNATIGFGNAPQEPRYGVEFDDVQFGLMRTYPRAVNIFPYEKVNTQ